MRDIFEHAGKTVRVKGGVGISTFGRDMSGQEFVIENVLGTSWMNANGNPAALEYAMRSGLNGNNNNVPTFSNDVVYEKIGGFGHLFHINELELESEVNNASNN